MNQTPTTRDEAASFASLGLIEPLLRALKDAGHQDPTPIQRQAIPSVLAKRDLLGCAQTGTGKTAAFALPILQYLTQQPAKSGARDPRVLILSPTRELASQIGDSFAKYGRHLRVSKTVIFGGVGQNPQVAALRRGVEVVIATPGRLNDLIQQGLVRLGQIEVLVLDEADRMLDEGFWPDVRRITSLLPAQRQTLFFSATMPPELIPLSQQLLRDPVRVEVTPVGSTPEMISQSMFHVGQRDKRGLLLHLMSDAALSRVLVFTRTKHGANRVAEHLEKSGIAAEAIHGNKSQNARERALGSFKRGVVRALVATDVAARGIDVDGVTHVINFDLPDDIEAYVHRIGRTARAGAKGAAFSFCDPEERSLLNAIERLIRRRVPVVNDHPFVNGTPPGMQPDLGARSVSEERGQRRFQRGRFEEPRPDDRRAASPRREEPRREEPRPAAPRREEPRREEPRAAQPRHDDPRVIPARREEPRRDPRREPRREEPRAAQPRHERREDMRGRTPSVAVARPAQERASQERRDPRPAPGNGDPQMEVVVRGTAPRGWRPSSSRETPHQENRGRR